MIVLVTALLAAIIATALYVGLHIYSYYLVEGVGKVLEVIEEPNLEEAER